ncbi:MAG: TIGR03435 family protein [Bryobacteraceae bacterium]
MKLQLTLAAFALIATTGLAQTNPGVQSAARRVVIEVASIRPSDPATRKEYPTVDDHGDRYDMRCVKAKFLIQTAFNVRDFQIAGGPAWIESTQYDIAAKIESSPNESGVPEKKINELTDEERQSKADRLRAMLQSLLAERFQMQVHRETKQLPVFRLVVAKGGPRLKTSVNSSGDSGGLRPGPGFLAGNRIGVPFLSQILSQIVGRPILDRTGLNGKYDFELKWTPDQSSANGPSGGAAPQLAAADPDRPNIFTALREQLGLKLDSSKGPTEVIVLDHIEKPSAN